MSREPGIDRTDQGEQFALAGTDHDQRGAAMLKGSARLTPTKPQQGLDGTPLFDPDSTGLNQTDLFD